MKTFLAADGGGTKLNLILYDESLRILNATKAGGTNMLTRSHEMIRDELSALLRDFFPDDLTHLDALDTTNLGAARYLVDLIREKRTIGEIRGHNEGSVPLSASGVRWGVTAQAGTGSDVFFIQPDAQDMIGGWGSLLGDEGSGYDIGMKTIRAAIHAYDGRAQKSVLPELLMKHWDLKNLWGMITLLTRDENRFQTIAAVTYVTEEAAERGDETALRIYAEAGHDMTVQLLTILEKHGGQWQGPIVLSGGAWKGCSRMADTFVEEVRAVYPDAEIRYPVFEPVVGCVVDRLVQEGMPIAETIERLKQPFSAYLFRHKKGNLI